MIRSVVFVVFHPKPESFCPAMISPGPIEDRIEVDVEPGKDRSVNKYVFRKAVQ